MLTFSSPVEFRIPQGSLLHAAEHFEFIPPPEHDARLHFQVFCNGMPIGHARLEKQERAAQGNGRVLNLFDARHGTTYALKTIQIAPNYRGRGIGTVLLKEILHYCRSHNIVRLTADIDSGGSHGDATRLRAWYRRNGFAVVNDDKLEFHVP
ncbi:MAG: GNAT family N-acetyltransferase [Pseudomonadota bacterium]|nr:GNAT family N-acetyltransferase [Pseudomonadota bacterium]